jgi:hypothetical protein
VEAEKKLLSMYIYHEFGGKIVMHRANSPWHLQQALHSDPRWTGRYVAGLYEPIKEQDLAALAKGRGMEISTETMPTLPPYVPKASQSQGEKLRRLRVPRPESKVNVEL